MRKRLSETATLPGLSFLGGADTRHPRTMLAWEPRPPHLPGAQGEARLAAGRFPKSGRDEDFGAVVVFGNYFDDATGKPQAPGSPADPAAKPATPGKPGGVDSPVKPPPPPGPERFTKWLFDWQRRFQRSTLDRSVSGVLDEGKPRKFGPDPGLYFESRFKIRTRRSWLNGETYEDTNEFNLCAAAVRRDGKGFLVYETG